jgi:hypothetical protein
VRWDADADAVAGVEQKGERTCSPSLLPMGDAHDDDAANA